MMFDDINTNSITDEEFLRIKPVTISVIGPTNEGKTSVLRTLTGDPNFGEVDPLTGTTGYPEKQKIFYRGKVEVLDLIDTPGFQMSSVILDCLTPSYPRTVDSILSVIPESDSGDFRHDRRAWTTVQQSDMVIFIANVAESPNQSLLRDTLTLLEWVDRPIIVLFNNIASEQEKGISDTLFQKEWEERLTQGHFFHIQSFDAHHRNFSDEYRLFEKIIPYIKEPLTQKVVRAELAERLRDERERIKKSRKMIAEILFRLASYREIRRNVEKEKVEEVKQEIQKTLLDHLMKNESELFQNILNIWNFHPDILRRNDISRKALLVAGDSTFIDRKRDISQGAMIGAALGLTLDIFSAGLSLGVGTTIGGLLGGLFSGVRGNIKYHKKTKTIKGFIEEETLQNILSQAVDLVLKLETRGQAVPKNILLSQKSVSPNLNVPDFFKLLKRFSENNRLLSLFVTDESKQKKDCDQIETLSNALEKVLPLPKFR